MTNEVLRKLKATFGRREAAVAAKANGDLNKDKLPRPYCGEIAFTDGGRVQQLIFQRDTCIYKSCCMHMRMTKPLHAGCCDCREE